MIEKIEHIDLLALLPYDIDEMVMRFYHQWEGEKNKIDIKRAYFYLDFAGLDAVKKKITQEEFEENRNNSEYISTLNYEDFEAKFNHKIWYEGFWSFVSEHHIFSKFNQSLKEIITNSTDIQIKILFKDLIQALYFSNKFLEEFQGNSVQRMVADELLKFNEKLYQELHKNYSNVFPEFFKEKKTDEKKSKTDDELVNSNIYKIALLFASGEIKNDRNSYHYNGQVFQSINKLSEQVSKKLGIGKTAVQPYLNSTLQNNNDDKNIFSINKLKYLLKIKEYFEQQDKILDSSFSDNLQKLIEESEM